MNNDLPPPKWWEVILIVLAVVAFIYVFLACGGGLMGGLGMGRKI